MAEFILQAKPNEDHFVSIHNSYKQITDGKATTAAVLAVLEYLAKCSLQKTDWELGDSIPKTIPIEGDCNFPRMAKLLDGLVQRTALREKMDLLAQKGYISTEITKNRKHRLVTYNHANIALALRNLSGQKMSTQKMSTQKTEGEWSENEHSSGQKVSTSRYPSRSKEEREESPYPLSEESGGSVEPAALAANQLGELNEDTPPQSPSPQKPVLRSARYTHPAVAMEERFKQDQSGGKTYHPNYSDMEEWGVEWIWDASKGDKLNGWSDEAIKAAIAQLKKTNQPSMHGDACRWLAIRVSRQRWSELGLLRPQASKPQQKPAVNSRSRGNITEQVEQGCMAELDLSIPLHQSFQEFLDLAHSINATVSYKDISRWGIHFWVGNRMTTTRYTFCQQSKREYMERLKRDVAERQGVA